MSTQALGIALCALVLAEPNPARASLDVDASALGEAGPVVASRLASRGEEVLRERSVLPATDPSHATIHVSIEPLDAVVGYRFSYNVTKAGALVDGARGSAECRLCNEAELSEQVEAAIARLAVRLQPDSEPPVEPSTPTPDLQTPPGPPAWVVQRMGGAGIVITAAGGLVLGLGTGLALSETLVGSGDSDANRSVVGAGVGGAVVGATLVGAGVALMLVERARSKRRSTAASPCQPLTLRF